MKQLLPVSEQKMCLKTDSRLVNGQLKGEFEAREANMQKYLEKAKEIIARLDQFERQAIPKAENMKAGALSKLASSNSFILREPSQ